MSTLSHINQLRGVILGYFKQVTYLVEKLGKHSSYKWKFDDFKDVNRECGFGDVGFERYKLTWNNKRDEDAITQVRLDQIFLNSIWLTFFQFEKGVTSKDFKI